MTDYAECDRVERVVLVNLGPTCLNYTVWVTFLKLSGVAAILTVYGDSAIYGYKAEYFVAEYG